MYSNNYFLWDDLVFFVYSLFDSVLVLLYSLLDKKKTNELTKNKKHHLNIFPLYNHFFTIRLPKVRNIFYKEHLMIIVTILNYENNVKCCDF